MSVTVKYFASLREELGAPGAEIEAEQGLDVCLVWRRATGREALPANLLAAVNHEYADGDHPVRDGDEVAFFPPVTGG